MTVYLVISFYPHDGQEIHLATTSLKKATDAYNYIEPNASDTVVSLNVAGAELGDKWETIKSKKLVLVETSGVE